MTKLEQDLNQAKFQLLQIDSTVARLRTDCSGYEVDQKTSAHKHDSLAQEVEGVRQEQTGAAQMAAEAEARAEEALAEKSRAHNESVAAQQTITDLSASFARRSASSPRSTARSRSARRGCGCCSSSRSGGKVSAKVRRRCFKAASMPRSQVRSAVPIMQGLAVKQDFSKAVEAILGAAAEAISVSDLATAQRILAQLENEQIGSAVLRVSDLGGAGANAGELPVALIPAVQALGEVDPAHPALGVLGECYVADDLGAFLDFWKANPGVCISRRRHEEGRPRRSSRAGLRRSPQFEKNPRTASCSAKSTCAKPPRPSPTSRRRTTTRKS